MVVVGRGELSAGGEVREVDDGGIGGMVMW